MQHSSPRLRSLLLLGLPLSFGLLAACSETRPGEYGVVEFVPDQCGNDYCDFDDGLALDATTDVYLDGVDGNYVDDLRIESADPSIAEVIAERSGLSPRVTIVGNARGLVDLLAVDRFGEVVDVTTIRVAAPASVEVDVIRRSGGAVAGPFAAVGVDDLYDVDSGTELEVTARQLAADGVPLMGNLAFTVVIGDALFDAVPASEAVSDGHFVVVPPAGEHTVDFETASATRSVHLSVK